MDKPNFVYVTYIRSTREKVWAALTDGAITPEYWYGHRIESAWAVGGPIRFYDETGTMVHDDKVLAYEPPALLSYSWRPLRPAFEKEPPSRVTFTLEDAGALVKLTMLHEDLEPGGAVLPAVTKGWPGVLSSLKSLLETGEALKIAAPVRPAS